jgi:hypothetical protein
MPVRRSVLGERQSDRARRRVRRALRVDERVDRKLVPKWSERVDRKRLVEDIHEQRLEPGVALAAWAARVALDCA